MNKVTLVVLLILSAGTTYAQETKTIEKGTLAAVSQVEDQKAIEAQDPAAKKVDRLDFNQVFVKVILPVTSRTPKQEGPAVESWVAKELKQLGVSEYFAVTDWVPICDALLEDDIVDNHVWGGGSHGAYCVAGGDIPERKDGQLLVKVSGFLPYGPAETNITLSDEPGNRAVGPVQVLVGEEKTPVEFKDDDRLPYVVVLIGPPPKRPAVIDEDITDKE